MSVLFIKVTVLFSTYQELAVRKVATNEGEKEKKRLNTELKKLMQTLQNVTTQKMALMESSCADRQVLEQRQEKTTALQNQLEDAKATLEELRTGHVTEKKINKFSANIETEINKWGITSRKIGIGMSTITSSNKVRCSLIETCSNRNRSIYKLINNAVILRLIIFHYCFVA